MTGSVHCFSFPRFDRFRTLFLFAHCDRFRTLFLFAHCDRFRTLFLFAHCDRFRASTMRCCRNAARTLWPWPPPTGTSTHSTLWTRSGWVSRTSMDTLCGRDEPPTNSLLWWVGRACSPLQASVYHILPPPTAIIAYTTGLRKRSAHWQFFVGAQICNHVCNHTHNSNYLITAHNAYASTNKTKIVGIEMDLIFTRGGRTRCLRACFDDMVGSSTV